MKEEKDMEFGLLHNFFNTFCEAGGLSAIMTIINSGKSNSKQLTLEFISNLLSSFGGLKLIVKENVIKELVKTGEKIFFEKFQALSEKEIKDLSKEDISSSLEFMRRFLKMIYTEDEVSQTIEKHMIHLSLILLKSPFLEKQLNGLADIKRLIERVNQASNNYNNSYRDKEPMQALRWLNAELLSKWIIDNKILEMILSENAHAELVKRLGTILIFLAKQKKINPDIIDLLWRCQQGKHEDIVRVVYDIIKDLVEFLNVDEIKLLNEKIKAIPLDAYDEKMITFMKSFTIAAFTAQKKQIARENKKKEIANLTVKPNKEEEEHLSVNLSESDEKELRYCIPKFWELIQDESPISSALTDDILIALKETLKDSYCGKFRDYYLGLCLENLKNHKSVPQSLLLATSLLPICCANKNTPSLSLKQWLSKLSEQYPLMDYILASCENYMSIVSKKLIRETTDEEVGSTCFDGKYNHLKNLEERFKFIDFLLIQEYKDFCFKNKDIEKLWLLYVINCNCVHDTTFFLKWLSLEKETIFSNLGKEKSSYLFGIICKSRGQLGSRFNKLFFQCFAKFFKIVNFDCGAIDIRRGHIKVKNYELLQGVDSLWENVINTTADTSRDKFSELLVEVYHNISETIQNKMVEIWKTFIDKCMKLIMSADVEKDDTAIANLVRLLLLYIEITEGKKYQEIDETGPFAGHKFALTAILKPGNLTLFNFQRKTYS